MIVAAVQIASYPGDVQSNIKTHVKAIHTAANAGASLIAFPELSLTGYEPTLAEDLTLSETDPRLEDLFSVSRQLGVTLAVGLPTPSDKRPKISHLFICPDGSSGTYSKQRLHDDEKPYFSEGERDYSLRDGNELVVPAICYESLFPESAERAADQGATLYLACVAKPEASKKYAHSHFPKMSKTHDFVVIMCNAVGKSDSFVSVGYSAAWNRKGDKIAELGADSEGILIVDVARETAERVPLPA